MANMAPLNASTTSAMSTTTGQPAQVLQIAKPPVATTAKQAVPGQVPPVMPQKSGLFAPKKEDQSILNQTNSDPKAVAGQFNGMSSFIDGYLRIAKRRYVARGAYNVG